MSNEINRREEQAEFYSRIYAGTAGYMCFAYPWKGYYEHRWFKYPDGLAGALDFIKYSYEFVDVYHCAHLFLHPNNRRTDENGKTYGSARIKENAVPLFRTAWADLDDVEPRQTRVCASIVVETSPDRYQAYWTLPELERAEKVEELNRKIIIDARKDANDKSGWCLTKLLRVPWTINHKPAYEQKYGYKPQVVLWP